MTPDGVDFSFLFYVATLVWWACRIAEYLRERQAREDQEAARKAGKREVADRIYEQLKGQAQAEAATREEEDRLINLLRAEEEAERARR